MPRPVHRREFRVDCCHYRIRKHVRSIVWPLSSGTPRPLAAINLPMLRAADRDRSRVTLVRLCGQSPHSCGFDRLEEFGYRPLVARVATSK
jgi:hypothetical protein